MEKKKLIIFILDIPEKFILLRILEGGKDSEFNNICFSDFKTMKSEVYLYDDINQIINN